MVSVNIDNRRKSVILCVAFVVFLATCLRITSSRDQITSSTNCASFYDADSPECHPEAYVGKSPFPSPTQVPSEVSSPYDKSAMEAGSTVKPEDVPHENFKAGQQKTQNNAEPVKSG